MSNNGFSPVVISGPVVALIEVTASCSHGCAGCGNVFSHSNKHMPLIDFKYVLDELGSTVRDVRITGGEPTLNPHFPDIINELESRKLSFAVLTNGDWDNPQLVLDLLRNMEYFRGFLISLHGATPNIHDSFVSTKGSFQRVIENIRAATSIGLYVSTNTILHAKVVNSIVEIEKLSASLGAFYAVFNRYYGAPEIWQITQGQLKAAAEYITTARQAGRKIRLGNCTPKCVADCDCDGCPGGNYIVTIDPWLNAKPCNHSALIAGNLRYATIPQIWAGEKMQQWRMMVPSECSDCDYVDVCAGGCRAEGILRGLRHDPLISPIGQHCHRYPSHTLKLYRKQTFKVASERIPQKQGEMLFWQGEVVLINSSASLVLNDFEGGCTIDKIIDKYGSSVIHLVKELLLSGFIVYRD